MLDLEVVPERSLGNEQWEFILGMEIFFYIRHSISVTNNSIIVLYCFAQFLCFVENS